MIELNVQARDKKEKLDGIREKGKIPAVFYGPKEDNTLITVNEREFIRVWEEAGGSAIVDLKGIGDDKEVLVHDVAWHPVKGTPIHVDFYCIERGKLLTVTVPLNFVGVAPVEKEGGIVVKVMHEIEVEVKPRDIPQSIDVDVTLLTALDSNITISDLNLPETIKPTSEVTENVVSVTQAQEEPEPEEEREITDIEIEGEENKESEEGEKTESTEE
ncbi:MAG: 50S ribosomal protein L25 [Candidatus Pacebacteria bacterium]|nr:50S ribosomal protein L25 [Candidatus Paceibacterota bacterium]